MDPQKTVVTSEALLGALQMPLPWGTTAGLRLPTYNPLQQDPNATSQNWPALAAPTPIHPNNPIYNGISQDILANILRIQGCTEITEESITNVSKPSSQISNLTAEQNRIAALKLEEKIKNESQQPSFNVKSEPQQFNNHPLTPEPSPPSASTFTRAPGHGPDDEPPTPESLVCPECGFACQSKFHFNSHMNTHGDHKCKICNYTSRTEGRVNKHMRDSHSIEEQIAAGVDPNAVNASTPSPSPPSGMSMLLEAAMKSVSPSSSSSKELTPDGIEEKVFQIPFIPHLDLASPPKLSGRKTKPKRYSCKHCDHVSTNKNERYEHSKLHIPVEKQLCCPKCSFVTEYKHHLEYHLRNHYNSKPFFCDKCNYACVNKSMLNSHLKSHSTDYHFKCMDCTYATKYCHSLKLHLKKYDHRRLQTEEDKSSSDNGGSPGALDVMTPEETNYAALLSNAQIDAVQSLNILHPCTICGFQSDAPNEQIKHNFQHLVNGQMSLPMPPVSSVSAPIQIPISSASLLESLFSGTSLSSPSIPVMVSQAEPITVEVKVEVDQPKNASIEEPMEVEADAQNEEDIRQECLNKLSQIQELQQQWRWKCETCRICFQDETLYLLHLKCHGDGNPFQCANCPFVAENALDFNEHLMQGHPVNSP